MIRCHSNALIICLLFTCLGMGACSESQDVAGSCKGDLEETINANTHLLANKKIAKEVQEWILKLGKGSAMVGAWGGATRRRAELVARHRGIEQQAEEAAKTFFSQLSGMSGESARVEFCEESLSPLAEG